MSNSGNRRRISFRSLIMDISLELTSENTKGLLFLAGLSSCAPSSGQCENGRCCPHATGSALDSLQRLKEKGVYSETNLQGLVNLLQEVGRHDLASKCEEIEKDFSPVPTPAPSRSKHNPKEAPGNPAEYSATPTTAALTPASTIPPPSSASATPTAAALTPASTTPTTAALTPASTPPPPLAPATPTTAVSTTPVPVATSGSPTVYSSTAAATDKVVVPLSRSRTPTNLALFNQITSKLPWFKRRNSRKSTTSTSFDEYLLVDSDNLDATKLVGTGDVTSNSATPNGRGIPLTASRSCDDMMPQRDRSWTEPDVDDTSMEASSLSTISLPSVSQSLPLSSRHKAGPTYEWTLKRGDFLNHVFNHTNKFIEKRFSVVPKSRYQHRLGLTFVLKLYPNGLLDWDRDSFATLKVEVLDAGPNSPASTLHFEVLVTEPRQCLSQRRKVCKLQEEHEFVVTQFLSHDVVKNSQARSFTMTFYICLGYHLGEEDWVCVAKDQVF